MLSIDKKTFFSQRKLPNKSYYYSYNGKNYEIPIDYVISSINKDEEKCLFLLNELKATDDFIINVYLQDLADECMQRYIRSNLMQEIKHSLIDKRESYKFTLTDEMGEHEYIAYIDEDGRYHVNKIEKVGIYAGWARFSRFYEQLSGLLERHNFNITRIENPEAGQ
jgi:hypothetical protein